MTKYSVYTERCEFKSNDFHNFRNLSENEILDAYLNQTTCSPECIGTFNTLEEAKKIYDGIKVQSYKMQGYCQPLIIADIAYIDEEEWEIAEDGEEEYLFGGNCTAKAAPYIEDLEENEEEADA